jgi:hypothetical protein
MKLTLTSILLLACLSLFAQNKTRVEVRDIYCDYLHLQERDSAEWVLKKYKKLFTKEELSLYILASYAFVEREFGDISFYSTWKFRRLISRGKRRNSNDVDYLVLKMHSLFLNEEYESCVETAESLIGLDSLPSHYQGDCFPKEWMGYKHASEAMIMLDQGFVLNSIVDFSKVDFLLIYDWDNILLNYATATSCLKTNDNKRFTLKKQAILAVDSITDLINSKSLSSGQHHFAVTALIRSYLVLYDSKLDWNKERLEYFSDKFHRDLALAGDAVKTLSVESQKIILEAVVYDFFERDEGGALELGYTCRRTKDPVICEMQKHVENDYDNCYEEINLLKEELE